MHIQLRGTSHYAVQAERPLPKFLSRAERRSSLKYIMSVFLSNSEYFIEKKFDLLTRVWIYILSVPKLLPKGQIFSTKNAKKCCHVGIFTFGNYYLGRS